MNDVIRELDRRGDLTVKTLRPGVFEVRTFDKFGRESPKLLAVASVTWNTAAVRDVTTGRVYQCWGEDQFRALLGVLCA